MVQSLKYAQWAVRWSIAIVFLWFGIDKFLHPDYWINAWFPPWIEGVLGYVRMNTHQFAYLNGIFEILVGVSFISGLFMRLFSAAAIAFLVGVIATHGLNEVVIRDIAIIGGCLAIFFWPDRRIV